jgi:hypothetical protein
VVGRLSDSGGLGSWLSPRLPASTICRLTLCTWARRSSQEGPAVYAAGFRLVAPPVLWVFKPLAWTRPLTALAAFAPPCCLPELRGSGCTAGRRGRPSTPEPGTTIHAGLCPRHAAATDRSGSSSRIAMVRCARGAGRDVICISRPSRGSRHETEGPRRHVALRLPAHPPAFTRPQPGRSNRGRNLG